MKKLVLSVLLSLFGYYSFSQNTRLKEYNDVGWYSVNTTLSLDDKWSLAGEFHLRRDNLVSDPQQTMFKVALNRLAAPGVNVRVGYTFAETYNYGTYPLNAFGKQFSEHRAYEMVSLNNKTGIIDHTHRFMLEQRWVGRYSSPALDTEDEFPFTNRFRYMYRFQIPLKGREISDRTPYAAIYDEILVGFGKNVNENVFDQNRFGALLGYRFSPVFRLEGGFISQIAQLSREINGRNVFQHNRGLIINGSLNF